MHVIWKRTERQVESHRGEGTFLQLGAETSASVTFPSTLATAQH